MGSEVAGGLSPAWVMATAEAWPFRSPQALRESLISLDPRQSGGLQRELEEFLRLRAGGASLDALGHLREMAWFGDLDARLAGAKGECSLGEHLAAVAGRYLCWDGLDVGLRLDPREGGVCERAAKFRWLTLSIPQDLLLAAVGAAHGITPARLGRRVSLAPPMVKRFFTEREVANTHVHQGGAFDFSLLWQNLVAQLSHQSVRANRLDASGFCGFPVEQAHALLPMALFARVLMAEFLFVKSGKFGKFVEEFRAPGLRNFSSSFVLRLVGSLVDLAPFPERPARRAYQALTNLAGIHQRLPKRDFSEQHLLRADPLAPLFSTEDADAFPETQFTCVGLDYLLGPGKGDVFFAQVFWQYQRVRNLYFSYVTQEAGTYGLSWFVRYFDRIWPLRAGLLEERTIAAGLAVDGVRLRSSEHRTTVFSTEYENKRLFQRFTRSILASKGENRWKKGEKGPEVGFVAHLIKKSGALASEAPRGKRPRLWASTKLAWQQAVALGNMLKKKSEWLLLLRGFDIAGTELSCPNWVFVAPLRHVQKIAEAAVTELEAKHPDWKVSRPRFTVHAGEDYRRIVEGLRNIHEFIEAGVLSVGDRIGHGLALGEDPARFSGRSQEAAQPAEQRLDDLLWELDRYAADDFAVSARRTEWVKDQASILAKKIFGVASVDLVELRDLRRCKLSETELLRLPFYWAPFLPQPTGLLGQYFFDPAVHQRCSWPAQVPTTDMEPKLALEAQRWLCRKLAHLGITVESNPSSNLVVGLMNGVDKHPSFQLRPISGRQQRNFESPALSINSDDPLTFATNLPDEYAHLYYAMLFADIPSEDALAWLDQARQAGLESRFTLESSRHRSVLKKVLKA